MIEISDHARKAMADDDITEAEVKICLTQGELEIKQFVNREMRYGTKLELKDKTIMVIYTLHEKVERVITAYVIRRKKWRQNE